MDKAYLRILGYEVNFTVGTGSFGKIKLARAKNGTVAIKIIDCKEMKKRTPILYSKFLAREIDILGKVRHPHIIRVHKIRKLFNRRIYIVMEMAVMDLHTKIIELGVVPIEQAKKWFCQLLSAIIYLHGKDIAHRDLKCENILLTFDNQVKLADFGFARFLGDSPELSQTYCGSPWFAAPELLMGLPYDPKKSDVWSMGIIFYAMITGNTPFNRSSIQKIPYMQCKALMYPKNIRVSKTCRDFISFMLQFNPRRRPSMIEVAQHPWLQSTYREVCSSLINIQDRGIEEEPQPSCSVTERKGEGGSSCSLHTCSSDKVDPSSPSREVDTRSSGEGEPSCLTSEVDPVTSHNAMDGSLKPELEDNGVSVDADVACSSIEDEVEEESVHFRRSPFSAAAQGAAKACAKVKKGIQRAFRSLRGRMKRFVRRTPPPS